MSYQEVIRALEKLGFRLASSMQEGKTKVFILKKGKQGLERQVIRYEVR